MKQFYQSKTLIVGVLEVAIGLLAYIKGEVITGSTLTSSGVIMIVLRLLTNQAVRIIPEEK